MIDAPPERYVLCLDDDPEFIKSLEAFLPAQVNDSKGDAILYRFAFFQDPREALGVLSELVAEGATVAMLISDQQMPSMKGIELLRRSRAISSPSMRILLTGHAGIEAAITAINDQLLDRYLTKPIENERDFTLSVKQLLQHFEMRRTIEAQGKALQDLYRFANTLNAMGDLDSMLGYVAHFTETVLECREVLVTAGEPNGRRHRATVGIESPAEVDGAEWPSAFSHVGIARVPEEWTREALAIARGSNMDLSGPVGCASLRADGAALGLLLAGQRTSPWTETEIETLGYIADTASVAIHKQLVWTQLEEAHAVTRRQAAVLDQANGRLSRLDEIKSEFLRFISHELRTPLSSLSAIGLLERPLRPEDWKELGGIIQNGYRRLDAFITAGLDYFSWCGMGRIETDEITDWAQVVRARWVHELAGPEVARVVPELPHSCEVRMSPATAERILRALVENAVKFSPKGAAVKIEVSSTPDRVRIVVLDHGRGFEPEIGPELFRPFTVMDTLHHREGTGLSLARTAAMVEAHDGHIRAESQGPGSGATFIVELPAYRGSSAAEADGSDGARRAA